MDGFRGYHFQLLGNNPALLANHVLGDTPEQFVIQLFIWMGMSDEVASRRGEYYVVRQGGRGCDGMERGWIARPQSEPGDGIGG